jgi:hypothetical protein
MSVSLPVLRFDLSTCLSVSLPVLSQSLLRVSPYLGLPLYLSVCMSSFYCMSDKLVSTLGAEHGGLDGGEDLELRRDRRNPFADLEQRLEKT